MAQPKLSRRIGGLTAAIVLGIAGIGVLSTPAYAAASFQMGTVSSYIVQLPTGYTAPTTVTVDVKNTGDTAGDPKCAWSSATGTSSTKDSTNRFTIAMDCPSTIAAGQTATVLVTIPVGLPLLATGSYYLLLGLDGGNPTMAFRVQVQDPVLASVSITDSTSTAVTETSVGAYLNATPASGAYPSSSSLTYQWYCGGTAIADATKSSYTTVDTDVSCNPGITVKATAGAGAPGAITQESSAVKVVVGDKLGFQDSNSQTLYQIPAWNLVTGYPATDQVKTVKLVNTGTTTIDISKIQCSFQTSSYYTMDGDVTLAKTTGDLGSNASIDVTLTAKPSLPAGTSQTGSVLCTTGNYGRVTMSTNLTVKDAALSGVSISYNNSNDPAQVPVGKQLLAKPSDDAYPPDLVTYQWYCGNDPISGQTNPTYTPVLKDQSCAPGIVVKATIATITQSSKPAAVKVGDQLSISGYYVDFPLLTGYDAANQAQTASLVNAGTTTIAVSDIQCAFASSSYYSMTGTVSLPKDVTSLAPNESLTITITPEAGLPAGTDQSGQVTCATPNFGTASIYPSVTVKDAASLTAVTVTVNDQAVTQSTVGTRLEAEPSDDAYPSNAISYQWYCGSDAITGATQNTYTPAVTDVACNPGVSVQATVTGVTPQKSSVVKVTYGEHLSAAPSQLQWALVQGYDITKQAQVVELQNTGLDDITSPITCAVSSTSTMKATVSVGTYAAIAPTSSVAVTITPEDKLPAGTNQSGTVVCSTNATSVTIPIQIKVGAAPVLGDVSMNVTSSSVYGVNPSTGQYDVAYAQVGSNVTASLSSSQAISDGAQISWKWFCGTTSLGTGTVSADQTASTLTVLPENVGCGDLSAQASMTVGGTQYQSNPSPTVKVSALSLTTGGDNYPDYPYDPSWTSLYTGYDVSKLNAGTLILTNWGTATISNLTCTTPNNTSFDIVTQPASSLDAQKATAMQIKPKAGLSAQSYFQQVICMDTANGVELAGSARATVTNAPTVSVSVDGAVQVGQTVAASVRVLPDNASLTYRWFCQNSDGTRTAPKNASTAANYTITSADIGCNLGVTVTATDGTATATGSSSTSLVPTVSITGADSWYGMPIGYTAANVNPASDKVTITNNGTTALTNVSFECPLPANNPALTCTPPTATTLDPGQSVTATITPQLGLAQGTYGGDFSVTYTEKGRPVTLDDSVTITVVPAPIAWIEPTNGTKTPASNPSGTPSTPSNPGGSSTGTPGGSSTGTPGTPGGSSTGTPGTPGGSSTSTPGTPGGSSTGTPTTPATPSGSSTPKSGGTAVAPSANGTTPNKIDTGGTVNNSSAPAALLGLGFIALGAVILKRYVA